MTTASSAGAGRAPAPAPGRATLACPLPRCRAVNDATAEICRQCHTPLRAYARLRSHPARLFNEGLAAAREGRIAAARDRFAAVVHWCPHDTEARSALGLACLLQSDAEEARRQWDLVLERRPNDTAALRGLAMLTRREPAQAGPAGEAEAEPQADTPAEAEVVAEAVAEAEPVAVTESESPAAVVDAAVVDAAVADGDGVTEEPAAEPASGPRPGAGRQPVPGADPGEAAG